jgi:hypothetical protein
MPARNSIDEKALKELVAIKKLLVLQLLSAEIQATSIARLLEMDKTTFSKMFPARELLPKRKKEKSPKR